MSIILSSYKSEKKHKIFCNSDSYSVLVYWSHKSLCMRPNNTVTLQLTIVSSVLSTNYELTNDSKTKKIQWLFPRVPTRT